MIDENLMIPNHIGIIMDGNRRWAKSKMLPVKAGHLEGKKEIKRVLRYIKDKNIEIKYLTVYAFSTENWKRSEEEISNLMEIFLKYINDVIKDDEGLRVKIIGDKTPFSDELKNKTYNYKVTSSWETIKDGTIEVSKQSTNQLILTTCSKKDKNKQLIVNTIKKET